ncbi:hypothetical protein [Haloglomus salinum]|jgi:hypothetical protein|uniref:hypothetical protein n=1 Tax=Haloglomus salinum TaxID=2962673 RepID=UPI0020C9C05F|nr:hypothetical protein [Haloglomus salinum]
MSRHDSSRRPLLAALVAWLRARSPSLTASPFARGDSLLGPDSVLGRRLRRAHHAVERFRVREHLRRTEHALRRADRPDLTPEQRRRRERHLDRLRAYWRRGRFPSNHAESGRAPAFVSPDDGTLCAVANLLERDHPDLVARTATRDNTVRVEAVEGTPLEDSLAAWAEHNGFTRAELARVQPSYPHSVQFATTCGPVACWVAGAACALVGSAVFATTEWVGYRLVGEWFPAKPLKRRAALGYATAMNGFLAVFLALVLYALFP